MNTLKPKPDMMAASPASGSGGRILAQLEHGARPVARPMRARSWTIDGWTVGLCVLLLLMCSVAWLMHKKAITPTTFKYSESRSRPAATAARGHSPISTTATRQSAAIVNEAPAATTIAIAPSTGTSSDRESVAATVALSATVEAARGMHGTQAARAPQAKATQPAPPMRNAGGGAAQSASAAHDTDVTLLTALVAHANKPTVTPTERSRDVVERQEGDSTPQLLARCQQLGLIEGMLCRSRICSGRWEADAACRAPAR